MNYKAVALLFALTTSMSEQSLAEPDPSSAAQCATKYSQILQSLQACFSSQILTQSYDDLFFSSNGFGRACKETLENPSPNIISDTLKGICLVQWSAYDQMFNDDPAFRFNECEKQAERSFAVMRSQCAKSTPSLFSSSCTWTRAIAASCHTNCSGPTCQTCSYYDLQIKIGCNSRVTAPARVAPGFLPFCQETLNAGSECRKQCAMQSAMDLTACTANCNASARISWEACWISMGMTPPPLDDLPNAAGGRGSAKSQTSSSGGQAKTTAVGVNSKIVKPLPPNPCRNSQRCGTSSSAGLAPNTSKQKINLDQHDFAPSFVNANPNAGRIGNRQGSGSGSGVGSAAKTFSAPIKASPMDGAPR